MTESQSLSLASYEVSSEQQHRIAIPRRFTGPMREMLALQPRFLVMTGRRGINLLEHRRFRAAYDFMMLLSDVGLVDADVAKFWTDVQEQSAEQRVESFQLHANPAGRSRRRRKRRRQPSSGQSE